MRFCSPKCAGSSAKRWRRSGNPPEGSVLGRAGGARRFRAGVQPSAGVQPPHIVVQNNVFNASKIHTGLVCALTSNLKRALSLGNVLLELGEGSLPKQSVVLVSQIFTVDTSRLGEWIGHVSEQRVRQILEGIALITEPCDLAWRPGKPGHHSMRESARADGRPLRIPAPEAGFRPPGSVRPGRFRQAARR